MSFNKLIRNNSILKALMEEGIENPTTIQSLAIPVGLNGEDIIAKSQTGTGKTLAFMLPILENLSDSKSVQAIIICPTRELCMQVAREIQKYIRYLDDVNVCAVYGGQFIGEQIKELKKKPQIVVATPGRLIDHFTRKTIRAKDVNFVVLDEADEMISIGFKDELDKILEYLPSNRQTSLFSATFPKHVKNLVNTYLTNPITLEQGAQEETISTISQKYLKVKNDDKLEVLKRLLYVNPGLSIVFCNTKKKVDETVASLQQVGFIAEALHGDLVQIQRDNVMRKMRNGILNVLVATDVAARGIDVKGVAAVYNFDFPDDVEYYVHRIGRTGRAGLSGNSYLFVTPKQTNKLKNLIRYTKSNIDCIDIPEISQVNSFRVKHYLNNLEINDCVAKNIFDELLERGLDFETIARALISDKFKVSDFDTIVNKKHKKDRSLNLSKGQDIRLFINAGRRDKLRIKHIIGAFKNQSKIKDSEINNIEIKDEFSFVTVPEKHVEDLRRNIKLVHNSRVKLEVANNPKRRKRRR